MKTNRMNSLQKLVLVWAMIIIIIGAGAFTSPKPTDNVIKLTFVDHLQAGLIEQDVYVEKQPGSGKVFRVLPEEREKYLDAQVYTVANAVHHDPFDVNGSGPYPKGESMGMTLREWLGGSGTATYSCDEGWGALNATFENLVPNATYTLWHFFMPKPPTKPFTGTLDLPIGERDGSQSVFTTDANGKATLDIKFEHCLQLTDRQLASGLAIALHSDGKTYGPEPGGFGKATHVQLFTMLPDVKDVIAGQ